MYSLIVNPNSRSGKGLKIWQAIKPLLKERAIDYDVYFSEYQKHAEKIARTITSDRKEHFLIILGGDGTINEVLNGIVDLEKVVLGYIPTGSSNDFARAHHLPKDPVKALEKILETPVIKTVDLGILYYHNKKRYFMVSSGIGFDAAVCHHAVVSKLKSFFNRFGLGKLTYVGIALNQLLFARPGKMSITLDHGVTHHFQKAYFAAAMNHPYEGGGLKFCPGAQPDDRVLDLIIIDRLSKLKVLLLLPFTYKGLHTRVKDVHIFTCRHAQINTQHALPVHVDGEPIFLQKNIQFSLAHEQIKIIE